MSNSELPVSTPSDIARVERDMGWKASPEEVRLMAGRPALFTLGDRGNLHIISACMEKLADLVAPTSTKTAEATYDRACRRFVEGVAYALRMNAWGCYFYFMYAIERSRSRIVQHMVDSGLEDCEQIVHGLLLSITEEDFCTKEMFEWFVGVQETLIRAFDDDDDFIRVPPLSPATSDPNTEKVG